MLTEKDNAVQANAMETAVSADVSTRISQQLAELDEAYLHRAEKYIELLLAEKAAETGDAEAQAKCGDMYMSGNGESGLINRRKALFSIRRPRNRAMSMHNSSAEICIPTE